MNFNPNVVSKHAISLIGKNDPFLKNLILPFESNKSLTCYNGMRPSIPSSHFPTFEIEVAGVQHEWATTRGQRHHATYRCMVTVSVGSDIDVREDYITKLASAIVSIFQAPSNMRFSLPDKTLTGADYRIDAYDSMISNVTYNSTRDGTIGVAEWTWTVHCDEIINDGEFYINPNTTSGMTAPFNKVVR